MNNVDLISKELWDHYSGLPNPSWYQYKKELGEEEDTEDIIDLGNSNEEIQTQKKKYMGFVNTHLIPTYDQNLRVYSFVFGWFKTKTRQFWSVPFVSPEKRESYLRRVEKDIKNDLKK